MEIFRKTFLFIVGVVVIAYEEATKSIEEAAKRLERTNENHNGHKKVVEMLTKSEIQPRQ